MNKVKTKVLAALIVGAVLLYTFLSVSNVQADQYDSQIQALQNQINQNQSAANVKKAEGDTLQNKLAEIQAQVNAATAALNLTETQISQTNFQIDQQNRELDRQKAILKENLKIIYKQGEVSPLEVVASSKNLSDFVAQQEYLDAIKKKIDDNLEKIEQIKKDLDNKKAQLTTLSTQQQAQVNTVNAQKAEQANLLAQTRGDEARYQQQVAANKQQLSAVVAARAAAMRSGGFSAGSSGGCGGYPAVWCNAPQDSIIDNWSYPNRECTSYVAWKRASVGRPVGSYLGNAGSWPSNTSSPAVGDVIVFPYSSFAPYGHVGYVEGVSGSGVTISEFNFDYGQGPGRFGTRSIPFNSSLMSGVRYYR